MFRWAPSQPGLQSSLPPLFSLSHSSHFLVHSFSGFLLVNSPLLVRYFNMSIPSILAKGTRLLTAHVILWEARLTGMSSASFRVPWWASNAHVCLLNSTGWTSHVHPKLQNVQNWTHCLPPQNLFFLLFPLFLWMIPPSSQLPKPETRASFPSLLPFSPPTAGWSESWSAGPFSCAGGHSSPLQLHRRCPWLTPPHPLPQDRGECPNQPPSPGSPTKIILLKSQVSQHIPLLKTLHGPSLMSRIKSERLSVDMGTFKLALHHLLPQLIPCQSPKHTHVPATPSHLQFPKGLCFVKSLSCGSFCSPITPVPDNLSTMVHQDHTPPRGSPSRPMSGSFSGGGPRTAF